MARLAHNMREKETGRVVYTSISRFSMIDAVKHYNEMSYGVNPYYYGGKCKCVSGSLTCAVCRK